MQVLREKYCAEVLISLLLLVLGIDDVELPDVDVLNELLELLREILTLKMLEVCILQADHEDVGVLPDVPIPLELSEKVGMALDSSLPRRVPSHASAILKLAVPRIDGNRAIFIPMTASAPGVPVG